MMAISNQQTVKPKRRLIDRRAIRLLAKSVLVLVVVGILIGIFHNRILLAIGSYMAIHDPIEKSDLILMLNHEAQTIPFATADLFNKGFAPRIVLGNYRRSRIEQLNIVGHQHRFGQRILVSQGVPAANIEVIGEELKDTVDLGAALSEYCKSNNITSVIVVTSSPFSRLDRNDLLRRLAGQNIKLRMYPVRTTYFDETDWWRVKQGWIGYFDAYYLSLLHNFAR